MSYFQFTKNLISLTMWTDEEICRILEIFPEALESDVLVPRPYERPAVSAKAVNYFYWTASR